MKNIFTFEDFVNESNKNNVVLNESLVEIPYNEYVGEYLEENDLDLDEYKLNDDAYELAKNTGVTILSDKDLFHIIYDDRFNRVVGALFIGIGEEFSFDVVVNQSYQRQGIGSKLVQIAVDEYESLKDAYGEDFKIEVDVINPDMRELLENKFGFYVTGELSPTRCLMTKD